MPGRKKPSRPKTMSANQVAIKVLDRLLKLSPKELRKEINKHSGKKHWATEALERTGYFERLAEELKARRKAKGKNV